MKEERTMLEVGKTVKVKGTDIEGIVKIIDKQHPNIAVRIEITKGRTPITDYFADMLEVIH
jgi:hypothetical protein